MKITLDKKELVKALQVGGSFAGKSKVMPILDCVKIKVGLDKLTIVSTDSENAISKRLNGITSDEEGTFCVNMNDLLSYIKLINSDEIEINVNGNTAEVKHAKGSFTFPVENDDEFPSIKPDDNCVEVSINAALLNNWIADGKNFVASDELRPVMNGLYVYCKENELGCCASDGHALFTDNVKVGNVPEFSFILNKNAFKTVCDAIQSVEEVKVKVGTRNVMFVAEGVSVIARQIDGRYVNFKAVCPKDNSIEVKVDRKEMLNAITRSSVSASKASMLTRMKVDGFNLEISSEDMDFNKEAREYLTVEANGNIVIGFKASLLIQILNSISTDNVVITMKDPTRAAIFKEDNTESEKIYLLMPMMLND